ncbi:ABC transporter ATP-binding protein [Calycomorphotria hydatis]|uniref:Teichoic acids export ATP-binding protein TagH n=2 Tax=Calycomorphotria hydatis TaxID=2528027 RepID=A0A517T4I4_9PLAN|nr:polysaccharide ABC transporter ATP-binding protein [Calycomorphotria hydatis]QDT63296.1 Teichoic acids export ATP-binding protein TagH [Calycomorphotria hydatis]
MSQAIEVTGLSKAYRIGVREESADTLAAAAWNTVTSPLRNLRKLSRLNTFPTDSGSGNEEQTADTLWALKDVSFQISTGEVVGVIGRNGAGKSTLLKLLSRITDPTAGRARIHGRVSSLLEVGTGFHPELTGRENVYLNGTILGMTKREIDRKFDEIVDFSGVERFLDTPVKRYSSGMRVRLAFSVAAHLEPEILIIDEVLAVGDAEFQSKCIGKMQSVAGGGRTVLFVSHNMAAVTALCSRTVVLNNGKVAFDGSCTEGIDYYLSSNPSENPRREFPVEGDRVTLEDFRITSSQGLDTTHISFRETHTINLVVDLKEKLKNTHLLLTLWRRKDNIRVSSLTTRELPLGPLEVGRTQLTFKIPACSLFPGIYYWSISIRTTREEYLSQERIATFTIEESILPNTPTPYVSEHGVVHIATAVEIEHTGKKRSFELMCGQNECYFGSPASGNAHE